MFSKKIFGQRIKEIRIRAGETQTELGEVVSLQKSRISEIENGVNTTPLEKVVLICEHYNISSDYLLGLSDDPAPRGRTEPL